MKKIEEQELLNLQNLNSEFNKLKIQLGDLSLQKHGICFIYFAYYYLQRKSL